MFVLFCPQVLMSSKDVMTVMGLVLAYGNYMNGGRFAQSIAFIRNNSLKMYWHF